jgi:hypothetical protein
MMHPDPYTYADPCAETELDIAFAIVMGYTDEEITERVPSWLKASGTKDWVNEEWYETVSPDSDMSERQFEAAFNLLWDTGDVVRFVTPLLLTRDGTLWDQFSEFYIEEEVKNLDSSDDEYTGYGDE